MGRDADCTTEDERYLRALQRELHTHRANAKKESRAQVNMDLAPLENAFAEMRRAEIQRTFYRKEIQRYADDLAEMEALHFKRTQELDTWRVTFEANLERQRVDLASRLKALMLRNASAATMPAETEEQRELVALEQLTIAAQIGELKTKLARVRLLLAFKSNERIEVTIHPPRDMAEVDLLSVASTMDMSKLTCANRHCGRVKLSKTHPLCRNCQIAYEEGRLNGDWVGLGGDALAQVEE